MQISDLTMDEFALALQKTKTIIVPFGTVEAHGTHLPLSTDTLTPTFVAGVVAEAYPVMVAPPVHYGVCRSTSDHPGTIGISFETLLSLAADLVSSLYSQGLRNIILLTGHGGSTHTPALILAADRICAEHCDLNMAVLELHNVNRTAVDALIETPGDSHAGEYETSLIHFIAPSLVKPKSAPGRPVAARHIIPKNKLKAWPSAVNGDPTVATHVKGERIVQIMRDGLIQLIKQLEQQAD